MAISLNDSAVNSGTGLGDVSVQIDIPSGSNVVVVASCVTNSGSFSSCVVDSGGAAPQSMTAICTADNGDELTVWYYIKNPTTRGTNITVKLDHATTGNLGLMAASFENVDNYESSGSHTDTGTQSAFEATILSGYLSSGDWVLDACNTSDARETHSYYTGQTQINYTQIGTGIKGTMFTSSYEVSTGAEMTQGRTISASCAGAYATIVLEPSVVATPDSSSKDLRTWGREEDSSSKDLRVLGHEEDTSSRSLRTGGHYTDNSSKDLRTHGLDYDNDSKNLRTWGYLTDDDSRSLRTIGHEADSDSRMLRTLGESGATPDSDSKNIRTYGHEEDSSSKDLRVLGHEEDDDSRNIRTWGLDTDDDSRLLRTIGHLADDDSRNLRTWGCEEDSSSKDLRTHGRDSDTAYVSIRTLGHISDSDSRNLRTAGHLVYPDSSYRALRINGSYVARGEDVLYSEIRNLIRWMSKDVEGLKITDNLLGHYIIDGQRFITRRLKLPEFYEEMDMTYTASATSVALPATVGWFFAVEIDDDGDRTVVPIVSADDKVKQSSQPDDTYYCYLVGRNLYVRTGGDPPSAALSLKLFGIPIIAHSDPLSWTDELGVTLHTIPDHFRELLIQYLMWKLRIATATKEDHFVLGRTWRQEFFSTLAMYMAERDGVGRRDTLYTGFGKDVLS